MSYYFVQLTLLAATYLTWHVFFTSEIGTKITLFNDSFVLDKLSFVLKECIYISTFMAFLYSRQYNRDYHIPSNEFYVLGLLSVLGMMVLVSGNNFLVIFLGLELMSLPIYAMVALQRGKASCIEAAVKYFMVSAIATGILLYGMSMIFGSTKSLDLSEISRFLSVHSQSDHLIFIFGLIFIIVALAFKLGAAPFHMWVPDVYEGATLSATLFLSSAPKIAAFGLVIRLLVGALPALHVYCQEIWIAIAILSMAIGNLFAIVQTNIKRLFAYSSIAHMGYMILGLACGTPHGNVVALVYLMSYTIMNLCSFGIVLLLNRAGLEADEIRDYKGLNTRHPWVGFMMLIVLFSMAGIPPLVGFFSKFSILEALISGHLLWLSVLAIIFTIVGAYYYINLIKVMYFKKSDVNSKPIVCTPFIMFSLGINAISVLILGISPSVLFVLSHFAF